MTQPVWSPSAARVAKARLTRFIAEIGEPGGVRLPLTVRLVPPGPRVVLGGRVALLRGRVGRWDRVLEGGDRMPGARWFPGATVNFAENLVGAADERPALVFRAESGERRELSRAELHREVARLAARLRAAGV